jgi:hypothetical protein
MGYSRQRIHHEQHVFALITEILGNSGGNICTTHTNERRLVRRGYHHNGFPHPLLPQVTLNEFSHFSAPFTDQGDDIHIRLGIACHCA